jgi:hypothetical protein
MTYIHFNSPNCCKTLLMQKFIDRYGHVDLAYTFLQWSPVGVFSSVVFLEYLPRYQPCVEDRHWRYQLFGLQRSESQKLFHILGLKYIAPANRDFEIDVRKMRRQDGRRKRR